MNGNLFILTAPSGAGKTSLVRALLGRDNQVRLSISYTTRAPRPGEEDGRDYHFVSVEEFTAMRLAGAFLESAEVYGNYYGTSEPWIRNALAAGDDVLLEIDWQGAEQVRRLFADTVGIFIVPPSLDVLQHRLIGRGQDSAEVVARRLAAAREDISHVGEFDYVIINDDFDMALADMLAVFRAYRLRVARQQARYAGLFTSLNS
ncbi:guanylate kinase [Sulfuriferula thiophila]|uniref:guanylate kinase n=1 Tax=Sulfuriferula thiophila TaxID=1781211 RepID=UPI000F60FA07|nr:guanylate kinase [Sulfuriferula thiophila]